MVSSLGLSPVPSPVPDHAWTLAYQFATVDVKPKWNGPSRVNVFEGSYRILTNDDD